MRIVCISDTHNLHNEIQIPNGDILIHAGDFTSIGEKKNIIDFNSWLGNLPHKYKIVVAGNHDFYFETAPIEAKKLLTNAIYLENQGIKIEGLNIWGSPISPISPKFGGDWAFNIKRGLEIKKYWELIPNDVDLLITHCPPFGILDKNEFEENEGCKDLFDLLENKIKPLLHIFGHIHEAHGETKIGSTIFINASMVGLQSWIENYKVIRKFRSIAILTILKIKQILKCFYLMPKKKLHHKKISKLQWKIKNKPIIIDL